MDTNQKWDGSMTIFFVFVAIVVAIVGYCLFVVKSEEPLLGVVHCASPSDPDWEIKETFESDACYEARMQEQEYQRNKIYWPTVDDTQQCCMHCTNGQACGNSCISRNVECHQPSGCACD